MNESYGLYLLSLVVKEYTNEKINRSMYAMYIMYALKLGIIKNYTTVETLAA